MTAYKIAFSHTDMQDDKERKMTSINVETNFIIRYLPALLL